MREMKKYRLKKLNPKGISLVEVVIVMAILAIATSVIVMNMSVLSNNDLKKTNTYVKGILNNTRTYCLSKRNAKCIFYTGTDEKLYCKTIVNDEEISDECISSSKVSMYYVIADTKGEYTMSSPGVKKVEGLSGGELELSFDHSSGALSPVTPGTSKYVYAVFLKKKNTVLTYRFTPLTGRFEQVGM